MRSGIARTWQARLVGTVLVMLATPAAAEGPTCVTRCVEKTDACAATVVDLTGMDPSGSQLGCAQALFVNCVARCQETDTVVWNDYRVVVPGEGVAPGVPRPAATNEAGPVARPIGGYGARR